MTRERLGRGLGALLGEYLEPQNAAAEAHRIPLSAIVANPAQPRRVFSDQELGELASSIRENGLLQPLVVRPLPGSPGRFELIVGERRFRAVKSLGWEDVPAIVREATDDTVLVLALVENLQREALNPLEEAEGYVALGEKFELSQGDIAKAVGKDRSTVANMVRLLKLPLSVRKHLEEGTLTPGHARALLALEDDVRAAELARRAVSEGWSVREVERHVGEVAAKPRSRKGAKPKSPVVRALEEALADHLMTRVELREGRGGKGTIEIVFLGADDLERVFELITRRPLSEVIE
ncbi:MAG: ParB/RepB/Spo0J family partition protein [Longimicrobiales bacterium]